MHDQRSRHSGRGVRPWVRPAMAKKMQQGVFSKHFALYHPTREFQTNPESTVAVRKIIYLL